MRIVLFSDIHGNVTGLRSVLERVLTLGPVDQIICAGDILGGGGGHEDVLDMLVRCNAVMVRGNHEEGDQDIERHIDQIPPAWR